MKKNLLYLYLIVFTILSCKDSLQLVLPENIEVNNQEELEALKELLLNTDVFDGDIILGGGFQSSIINPINDLSAFENLKEITGDLFIIDANTTSIGSFRSLQRIGGKLVINSDSIESIDFPVLKQAEEIIITFCEELKQIKLEDIELVSGRILISENILLESIIGFDNMLSSDQLIISNNPKLNFIDGFSSLETLVTIFILEVDSVELTNTTFRNIKFIERLQCFVALEDGLHFHWLEKLRNYNFLAIRGFIDIQNLCPAKAAVAINRENFLFVDFADGNSYSGMNLLDICQ